MPIALVQSAQHLTPPSTFETSATATISAAIAGNYLLAWCIVDRNCGTITVPAGFTELGTQHNVGPSISLALAYKVAAGGETAISCSWVTAGNCKGGLIVQEYSGVSGIDLANITYTDDSNVNSRSTGTLGPTTVPRTRVLACFAQDSISRLLLGSSPAWTNGFVTNYTSTNPDPGGTQAGNSGGVIAYKDLTSIGTFETTFSYTGTSDQAMTGVIVLKEAGGQQQGYYSAA